MNRECNNRVRNGQYRVWGVPKNIYNLGMIFSAFCLDTMLPNGTMTTGCTVVDLKGYLKKKPNAKVCTDIDGEKFREWFKQSISRCI